MSKEDTKRLSPAEELIIKEFLKDLQDTADQVEKLLNEVQDSKINLVSIQTELKYLIDNVKSLTIIVKEGGKTESVLTRLALLEQSINEIKNYISKDSSDTSGILTRLLLLENKVEDLVKITSKKEKTSEIEKEGKFKLYATIATGVFALLAAIVAGIFQAC